MKNIHDLLVEGMPQFRDQDVLGVFTDNHDNSRFLHNGKINRYKSVSIYAMFCRGIPIVYYGSE